tara:strand:- start:1668 stop:1805 length:138 start_codon:yes stop_codon:yes gene_type:complete
MGKNLIVSSRYIREYLKQKSVTITRKKKKETMAVKTLSLVIFIKI